MFLSFIILVVGLFLFGNSDGKLGMLGAILLAPLFILGSWFIIVPIAFIWFIYAIFKYKI